MNESYTEFRYVGEDHAKRIKSEGISLEEYAQKLNMY